MKRQHNNQNSSLKTPEYMTLSDAAAWIGITTGRLRQMIRSGDLKAEKVYGPIGRFSYYYQITRAEVERLASQDRVLRRPRVGD